MAFIPVPEVVEAQLFYQDAGQTCMNTLYFNAGGTPALGDMQTLANSIQAWYNAAMADFISDQCALVKVVITDLGSQFGQQVVDISTITGQVTTEQAPNNVAPCISFRSQFRGRSFRGRNYIVGVPNASIDVNTLDPTWMTNIASAYGQMLPGGGFAFPGLYEWVVVSRYTNGGPRTTGIFTAVQSVGFTDNVVDSQRRRLPGRGA